MADASNGEDGPTYKYPGEGGDPSDIPIPLDIYGHEIEVGDKVIILVAGVQYQNLALVQGVVGWSIEPNEDGFKGVAQDDQFPCPNQYGPQAWKNLTDRYTNQQFKDSGWKLIAFRAHFKSQIEDVLNRLQPLKPKGLAFHYFGHGDSKHNKVFADRPYLNSEEGATTVTRQYWDSVQGKMVSEKIKIPRPLTERRNLFFTEDLAKAIKTGFPKDIPKTLIVDGCELAVTVDYKDPSVNFFVVSAEDVPRQDTILALFSDLFGATDSVVPLCFEDFTRNMPTPVKSVNATLMGEPRTRVEGSGLHSSVMARQQATWDKTTNSPHDPQ